MYKFQRELSEGQILIRDKLQFELKSDFSPLPNRKHNVFTQEFYFFIPNALQINEETYPHKLFYRDSTNFLRYKTPPFQLKELVDKDNTRSPLYRLKQLFNERPTPKNLTSCEDEVKLFGNIVRSAIRQKVRTLVNKLSSKSAEEDKEAFIQATEELLANIEQTRYAFTLLQNDYNDLYPNGPLTEHIHYVNAFISTIVDYHLTGLLEMLKKHDFSKRRRLHKIICDQIQGDLSPLMKEDEDPSLEYFLYQRGVLNKFVLDALLLNISRTSLQKRYSQIFGAVAAGIAMFLYILFFIWQGRIFVINSAPFVIATVVMYILKDRLKEWLKIFSHKGSARWFPDYKTKIRTPGGGRIIGQLKESFAFIHGKDIPLDIVTARNKEFHAILEKFNRPEMVMYYKKEADIKGAIYQKRKTRRYQLNNIFRFNIHRFCEKAGNPYHKYLIIDKDSCDLLEKMVPKVYHLNIIMKNSYRDEDGVRQEEFQKFRLILDKDGIKRIEQISRS